MGIQKERKKQQASKTKPNQTQQTRLKSNAIRSKGLSLKCSPWSAWQVHKMESLSCGHQVPYKGQVAERQVQKESW